MALFIAQGCVARPPHASAPAATAVIEAEPRIVTPNEVATVSELRRRAESALLEQRWREAADTYRLLLSAEPDGPHASEYLFDLGLALEGTQQRAQARDCFLELARRFPAEAKARAALVRAASLDAYLEDWQALQQIGDALLVRSDLDEIERLVALGSRGLGRVERDDDIAGSKDILDGLELADELHYGDRDVLPVAVAQLRFALGELRRIRSERIRFAPLPSDFRDRDFLDKLDMRCAGLLDAQASYAQAVRSVDPHWAAMAGYRVGTMYRTLHDDLMQIALPRSKTERQRQIFYAFMHIRYRILLEKGLREIEQTVALGERTSDSSPWIQRAKDARAEMQKTLEGERTELSKMPFGEAEVKKALDILAQRSAH